jgi:hypothetical protein
MIRVLVCGGRNFENRAMLYATLDRLHAARGFTVVIAGEGRLSSSAELSKKPATVATPATSSDFARRSNELWLIANPNGQPGAAVATSSIRSLSIGRS